MNLQAIFAKFFFSLFFLALFLTGAETKRVWRKFSSRWLLFRPLFYTIHKLDKKEQCAIHYLAQPPFELSFATIKYDGGGCVSPGLDVIM
jgi:hypothetical protein